MLLLFTLTPRHEPDAFEQTLKPEAFSRYRMENSLFMGLLVGVAGVQRLQAVWAWAFALRLRVPETRDVHVPLCF